MAVALDGTLNGIIFDSTSVNNLTIKTGANTVSWTLTFPTGPGTAGQTLITDGTGNLTWGAGGGGGTPAGANTQVQFNNAGSFGASANFTYTTGTSTLGLGTAGKLSIGNTAGTFSTTIQAGASTANWTLTLPPTAGAAGEVLTTDGAGNATWGVAAAAIPVTNDVATAAARYPMFTDITTGDLADVFTASPDYTYTPSTQQLSVPYPRASSGIALNENFIGTSYTIPAGTNGLSAGTVSFGVGVVVTAAPGSSWVIV
jgi:hypothetical protein